MPIKCLKFGYNKTGKVRKRNTEARWCNHCCSGKTMTVHNLSVFVALGIQHVMCMRHTVIVACPTLQNFSTLSNKRHDSRNQKR